MFQKILPVGVTLHDVALWLDGLDGDYSDRKNKTAYTASNVSKTVSIHDGIEMQFNGNDSSISCGSIGNVKTVSMWFIPRTKDEYIIDLDGSSTITLVDNVITTANITSPTIYVNGVLTSTCVTNDWNYITITWDTAINASACVLGKVGSNYLLGSMTKITLFNKKIIDTATIGELIKTIIPPVGDTLYVATTGDDSTGDGSIGNPWQTIQKGLDNLGVGDTLYIRGGTYTSGATKTLGGNPDRRIKVSAYPSETVTIDTSTTVTGWTDNGGGLYTSNSITLGSSFSTSAWTLWKDTTVQTGVTSTPAANNEAKITKSGADYTWQIYSTTDPSLSTFKVIGSGGTKSNYALQISGSYFDVNGIDTQFNYVGINIGGTSAGYTEQYTVTDCDIGYSGSRGGEASQGPLHKHKYGLWLSCVFHHVYSSSSSVVTTNHGFKFAADVDLTINGNYVTLDSCQAYNNSYHGIQLSEGWDGCTIRNCISHDNALGEPLFLQSLSDAADIRCGLQTEARIGHLIEDNTCYNSYIGIYLYGQIDGSIIRRNTIYSATMAGMWTSDSTSDPWETSNLIYNNIIRDCPYGIAVANSSVPIKFYNNTIDNSTTAGIIISSYYGLNHQIKNNISIAPTTSYPLYINHKNSNHYVLIPNNSTYNKLQSATSYSIEWKGQINYLNNFGLAKNKGTFIFNKNSSNQIGVAMWVSGDRTVWVRSATSGFSIKYTRTTSQVTVGAPLHLVFTWAANAKWKVYIDGSEASYGAGIQSTDTVSAFGDDTSLPIYLGGPTSFSGTTSKLRIYRNVELSAANVTTLFGGGTVAGVTGEYLHGDGSGEVLSDTANSVHGAIVGATWSGSDLVYSPDIACSFSGIDYNAYYCPDASPMLHNGTAYSFANYKTNSSQDTNGLLSDFTAEFDNYAGNDFDIGAGATTIKDAGTTISSVNKDFDRVSRPQGASYSIGAYEA